MATSGPGATNLVTCIADAYMDSIPMIAITGQVYQEFIGKAAFQETDFFGMTLPIVKHSYLVLTAEDLPKIVKEAFYLAESGRPGPVVIDIPKDVQQKVFEPFFPNEVAEMEGYKLDQPKATDDELIEVLNLISKAKKPVLYTGGGIISAEAHEELKEFAELTGLPVAHTLMGLGVFDPDHPQSCYWYGMHGTVAGNWAVCESDLLLCAGARFDDRITGKVDKYAQEAYVIHFDVDKSEHNKNVHANFPIRTDIKYALKRMSELIKEKGFEKPDLGTGWKLYPDGKRTIHLNTKKENTSHPRRQLKHFTKFPKGKQLSLPVLASIKCGQPNTIVIKNHVLISLHWVLEPWDLDIPQRSVLKLHAQIKKLLILMVTDLS